MEEYGFLVYPFHAHINFTPNSSKLELQMITWRTVLARSSNSTWWLKYQPVLPVYSCTFAFMPRERMFRNVRELVHETFVHMMSNKLWWTRGLPMSLKATPRVFCISHHHDPKNPTGSSQKKKSEMNYFLPRH
jgi:hypothetical protein